ncbi:MAG TPA: EamA family transporter, partial [bacterium]|nr:EamA family transporter [bacterium]
MKPAGASTRTMKRLLENRIFNIFLANFVLALWGFAFVFIRVAVREIPPVSLAFLRFVIALVILAF